MTPTTETYIGNPNTFAIRYVPGYVDKSKKYLYAYCHLVLAGQIIGEKEEICFLNTWLYSIKILKDLITKDYSSLCHSEFVSRTDREIFEMIWKANQLEEDYSQVYKYLPVLEHKFWVNCSVSLDETTDAFLIAMVGYDNKLKFIWQRWREPCPADQINRLYSIVVDREFVASVMEECISKIGNEHID